MKKLNLYMAHYFNKYTLKSSSQIDIILFLKKREEKKEEENELSGERACKANGLQR